MVYLAILQYLNFQIVILILGGKNFQKNNYSDFSRINYGVFFNWENFRGRNELLKVKIRTGFKEHFLISFQTPFINKNKTLGIGVDLNLFRRKKHFIKL